MILEDARRFLPGNVKSYRKPKRRKAALVETQPIVESGSMFDYEPPVVEFNTNGRTAVHSNDVK